MFTYYIQNKDNGKIHNCGHTFKAFKRAYNTAKAADVHVSGFRVHQTSNTTWSLRDAMAAAEALSDTLFPQMQVEQETLRLAKGA